MTRHHLLGSLAVACCLWGCADERTTTDSRTRRLTDANRDGLLKEENPPDDGCLIMEEPGDPGDCPIMSYTETHSVTVDADGNVLAETWQVCTQCFDETGVALGDPECFDEPPLPPDVYCEEYDGGDPTLDVVSHQPFGVGLVVHLVPDGHEVLPVGP